MSYEKNTWQKGDVITALKLNHIEDGIAGAGVLVVTIDGNNTLDHTWQEIYDAALVLLKEPYPEAASNGGYEVFVAKEIDSPKVGPDAGKYYVSFSDELVFVSATADGYPSSDEGGE